MEDGMHENHKWGIKTWYKDGIIHKDDGPAVIHVDGTICWYKNGKIHREDGPAVIEPDGEEEWYLNGIEYDKMDSVFDEAREKYPERFI